MKPPIRRWRLARLARDFGIPPLEISPVLERRHARVEQLIHELLHAVSLGLPVRHFLRWPKPNPGRMPGITSTVSKCLAAFDDSGAANEALVLAAERDVLVALGIWRGEGEELVELLREAGNDVGVPSATFLAALDTRPAKRLASRVLGLLADLVREPARVPRPLRLRRKLAP